MTDVDSDIDAFDETELDNAESVEAASWVELPQAGLLTVEDADEVLRWRSANVVSIIGERNGGKTTLVTEIYDRFLRGRFAGHQFCQSRTLIGFEKKSFQARAVSGAAKPDTPRTSAQDGVRFFHLGLVNEESHERQDLLVSERAGERYREVRDKPALAASLVEITKANSNVFLLDGERLADRRRRAEAFASIRNMARAFADAGAMRPDSQLQLVTTKFDLLEGKDATAARDALAEFEGQFAATYADRFSRVSTFRTAARDPEGVVEPAWGIAPLLKSWIGAPARADAPATPLPTLTNEFDRLLLRKVA